MQRVHLNGVDLEYNVQGAGEPLVLIHGSILADAFFPLLAAPRIASHHRVISYHRRGFAAVAVYGRGGHAHPPARAGGRRHRDRANFSRKPRTGQAMDAAGGGTRRAAGDARAPVYESQRSGRGPGTLPRPSQAVRGIVDTKKDYIAFTCSTHDAIRHVYERYSARQEISPV